MVSKSMVYLQSSALGPTAGPPAQEWMSRSEEIASSDALPATVDLAAVRPAAAAAAVAAVVTMTRRIAAILAMSFLTTFSAKGYGTRSTNVFSRHRFDTARK